MKSEFAFINRIRAQAARYPQAGLVHGIGEDAAVIGQRQSHVTLVTTDLLVEEVDFKLSYAPPRCLGHKALAVSLSDIAAMGGRPRYSLLTLGIPPACGEAFWGEFFIGYFSLAERYGVGLIGGDTSAAPDRLVIDSIVIGDAAMNSVVCRSGAQIGDDIYVTGKLGQSAAGLELLRRGERLREEADSPAQRALRAHLMPEPPIRFGRYVASRGLAHAMIDVSDGLAQDLAHLCQESGVSAIIDFEAVPVAAGAKLVTDSSEAAFTLAISGGEDFELLLTMSRDAESALVSTANDCQVRLTRIGEIVAVDKNEPATRLWLRRQGQLEPLAVQGYDHFAQYSGFHSDKEAATEN